MKNSVFRLLAVAALMVALPGCQAAPPPFNPEYGERQISDQPFDPRDSSHLRDVISFSGTTNFGGQVSANLEIVARVTMLDRRLIVCGVWIGYGDELFYTRVAKAVRQSTLDVEDIPVMSLAAFKGYWHGDTPDPLLAGCVEAENPVPTPWAPAYMRINHRWKKATEGQ